jgi:hypothetical protein
MTWRERLEMKRTDFPDVERGDIAAVNVDYHLIGLAEVLERVEGSLKDLSTYCLTRADEEDGGENIQLIACEALAALREWREGK